MFYNLDLFGLEVTRIRKNHNYTQCILSDLADINVDTLRKIENGKVIPNHITLELLSLALKVDLNQLLLNYRFDNYIFINDLITRINLKLEKGHFSELADELPILKNSIDNNDSNEYVWRMLKQLYLFIESILAKIEGNNYELCLTKLIDSIRFTTPNFDFNNFNEFVYSRIEIRLLMNIALSISKLKSESEGLKILKFCLSQLENDQIDLKIKIFYNLANNYYKLDLHEDSLHYSILGIDTCISNQSLSCLELLYYRKGIAEYYLNDKNYKSTLKKANALYEISGKNKLKKMFIDSCLRIHNIDIYSILSEST